MVCYFTLGYNTYAFSLLFYKIYMKRVNASSWNSGPERSNFEIPILHNFKCPKTLWRIVLEYLKNIWRRNYRRGPTRWLQAWGARLTPQGAPLELVDPLASPRMSIFCYMRGFDL